MVSVSASVNLPLHHKVQKFLFWHWLTQVVPEKGCKMVVVVVSVCLLATLRKNFQMDLHEIFREGWQWPINKLL